MILSSSDWSRLAVQPLKHSLLSLIHFCALLSFRVSSPLALPASSPSLAYLLTTTDNDRTLYPGSLDHSYHPHLYHLTAYVHVSVPDSLPHFLHAVFARVGPCSLYSLIVDTMSYYVPPYMHDLDESGPLSPLSPEHVIHVVNVPVYWVLSNAVKLDRGVKMVFRIHSFPMRKSNVSKTLYRPIRGYEFWRATFPGARILNKQHLVGSANSSS